MKQTINTDVNLPELNISSTKQLSILLFGGTVKIDTVEPILNELGVPQTFKTGNRRGEIKTKKVTKEVYIKGFGIKPLKEWYTAKDGIFQTNEKIIKIIAEKHEGDIRDLCNMILEIRSREKLIGTYYEGFRKYIDENNLIHAQFSHCGYDKGNDSVGGGTSTGRTSSNKPNIQNIPR